MKVNISVYVEKENAKVAKLNAKKSDLNMSQYINRLLEDNKTKVYDPRAVKK